MGYLSDWLALAEARGLVESCGHSRDEAELDICRAIADRKIRHRCHAIGVEPAGGLPNHLYRWRIPSRLNPQDFNWEESLTVTPWPVDTQYMFKIHPRSTRPNQRIYLSLELYTRDLVRVLCGGGSSRRSSDDLTHVPVETRQEITPSATDTSRLDPVAVHPSTRSKSSAKRQRASRALKEAFPDGVPDKDHMTDVEVCRRVQEVLGKAAENLSDDTILRAAGRRK
jgi:hypothetical protein